MTSERVKQLMENFITDRKQGMNIREIAEKYGVSTRHIYSLLGGIAEANGGLTREQLLDVPHKQHPLGVTRNKKVKAQRVNSEQLMKHVNGVLNELYELQTEISRALDMCREDI